MQADHDRTLLVRAELCERLAVLRSYCERRGPRDFARTVAGIRQLAAAYGLTPVVHLADALERAARASSSGGRETALYLDRLQDAIGCTRLDAAASEAMIASISVRFGA
jgi:hypothetical protein